MNHKIIAIDGPAGSGKSTTARMVARELGFIYLDTGAMYRSITFLALRDGIPPSDSARIESLARKSSIEFKMGGGSQRTLVNGEDVSEQIRTPEVTAAVSEVSAHPRLRALLVEQQRKFGKSHDLVTEGRDTTSVVFKDAFLKVYLDADVVERARRRAKEFIDKGKHTTLEDQIAELNRRDEYDSSRKASPLTMTDDAVLVDTTDLTIDEQVQRIVELYREKLAS
jgi:cytidylate kinase